MFIFKLCQICFDFIDAAESIDFSQMAFGWLAGTAPSIIY